jgi:hypothetical protein
MPLMYASEIFVKIWVWHCKNWFKPLWLWWVSQSFYILVQNDSMSPMPPRSFQLCAWGGLGWRPPVFHWPICFHSGSDLHCLPVSASSSSTSSVTPLIFLLKYKTYFNVHRQGRMVRGDHGLPKVLLSPAMPNPSTPCSKAVLGVVNLQDGLPAAVF